MKKLLALVLALVMTLSLATVSTNAAYADDADISYDEAVAVLSTIGVLEGTDGNKFAPKENLTRAQAAKIISYFLLGNKTAEALVGSNKFADVKATNWAAGYVDYCASSGIVNGVGDGKFDPNGGLTGFAFAKMLLVALGYDAEIEEMSGADWMINVSKLADQNDLFDGLDISGRSVITREQAAQMCLNTLKAPLVEYSNKGGSISINGATINVGSSDAEYVTTTVAKEQRISDKTLTNTGLNTKGGYTVEFGEKYYTKLVLKNDEADAFGRPAHTWLYDNEKIGTYAEDADYEYTTSVTGKEIYDALGKNVVEGKDAYEFTVYIDGAEDTTKAIVKDIAKNNKNDANGTDNGVLTQIFVDNDAETVTITLVHTYLAKADADYSAKKDSVTFTLYGAPVSSKAVDGEDFAITDVAEDDFYLVQYSKDTKEIEYLAKADSILDTEIDSFKSSKSGNITVAGTKYEYNETATYKDGVLGKYTGEGSKNNLKDVTYNVYFDQYGYVIGVEETEDAKNYVFIAGVDANSSNLSTKTYDANAIFTDGTSKVIEVKNTTEFTGTLPENNKLPLVNKWYTYTVSSSGVYTLTLVNTGKVGSESGDVAQFANNTAAINGKDIDKKNISLNNGSGTYAYGNDSTVYLTADTDTLKANGKSYTVISGVDTITTGVRNASLSVSATNDSETEVGGVFVLYKHNGYIISAVVVGEDSYASKNLVYVKATKVESESYNKTTEKWTWTLKAIQNGEEVILTETNDEGVSVLKKMANIVAGTKQNPGHNTWFLVSFKADGTVHDAFEAKLINTGSGYTLKSTDYETTLGDAVKAVEKDIYDTVLVDITDPYTKKNIELKGNSLQDTTSNNQGLFVSDDVKVVLIQDVDNDTVTTYDQGVKVLENTLKDLNDADKKINFWFNAIVEDGAVTTVIIRDTGDDGYTGNNGSSTNGKITAEVNVYSRKVTLTYTGSTQPTEDEITPVIVEALSNAGYEATTWDKTNPNLWKMNAVNKAISSSTEVAFEVVWATK